MPKYDIFQNSADDTSRRPFCIPAYTGLRNVEMRLRHVIVGKSLVVLLWSFDFVNYLVSRMHRDLNKA